MCTLQIPQKNLSFNEGTLGKIRNHYFNLAWLFGVERDPILVDGGRNASNSETREKSRSFGAFCGNKWSQVYCARIGGLKCWSFCWRYFYLGTSRSFRLFESGSNSGCQVCLTIICLLLSNFCLEKLFFCPSHFLVQNSHPPNCEQKFAKNQNITQRHSETCFFEAMFSFKQLISLCSTSCAI